jgi:hypothetical protein
MKDVLKALHKTKKKLVKALSDLPDKDAYARVYCIINDTNVQITRCVKELQPAIKEANVILKEHTIQDRNRAKDWCEIKG